MNENLSNLASVDDSTPKMKDMFNLQLLSIFMELHYNSYSIKKSGH